MAAVGRSQDRATFDELRRRGRRVRRGPLTVTWVPGPADAPPRVAFAVSRAVGNAVTRNRVRRRLRAIVSGGGFAVPPGAYLLSASPAVVSLTFDEMRTTVSTAIAAIALLPEPGAARRAGR